MAQLSGVVTVFEKALRDMIINSGGVFDWTNPQYSIVRLGQGQYDITLSLSGLGVQHIYLSVVGDELTVRGKIALIGNNPSFPFALFQELINSTVRTWLEKGLDSLSVQTPGSVIQFAQSEPLKIDYKPMALLGPVSPPGMAVKSVMASPKKAVIRAVVKGK